MVTEEQAESHTLAARTFLIVDPLDGTKEFVQRRGDFTVNIAYVQNGVPTHGIVYAPAKGRLFYTLPDGQAVEETVDAMHSGAGATGAVSGTRAQSLTNRLWESLSANVYVFLHQVRLSDVVGNDLTPCPAVPGLFRVVDEE